MLRIRNSKKSKRLGDQKKLASSRRRKTSSRPNFRHSMIETLTMRCKRRDWMEKGRVSRQRLAS